MKACFALVCGALLCLPVGAQNAAPAAKPKQEIRVEAPRPAKDAVIDTNILSSPKPPKAPKDSIIKYGGVGTEIARSTNRWKMFSLRRPRDPKEDGANLVRDLRTEGGGAFKLFSVEF